ncbi:MAG: glycosyltransferase family 2 protein [Lachnospiraceae bacterium]|nr:glycosyltransferase family 2 protein [Lachnospiraceae bacterium]
MIGENRERPLLILVVPCYNEEEIIRKSAGVLSDKLKRLAKEKQIHEESRVLFVDDGSTDKTFLLLCQITKEDPRCSVVKLAGNRGHQNAILAGMMTAKERADIVVTIDADLQQDIEALDRFIDCYKKGSEVVYGVRNDRSSDGFLKKTTASLYYKLMQGLGSNVITNHADYRLVSKKVLDALSDYREVNLFLRGLIPAMGFPSDIVYFDVKEREAGSSKYTLKKMLTLAMDGITSFSTRPLHLISLIGCIVVLLSVVMCIVAVADWILGKNVPGYTTLLIVTLIAAGVILLSLGVIGEYIGKIYMETKHRPHYIIDSVIWRENIGDRADTDRKRTTE